MVGFPHRLYSPVITDNTVRGDTIFFLTRRKESVGKNLVHYAALYPVGCTDCLVINGQLPIGTVFCDFCNAVTDIRYGSPAVIGIVFKVIPINTADARSVGDFPPFFAFFFHTIPCGRQIFNRFTVTVNDKPYRTATQTALKNDSENSFLTAGYGAKRIFMISFSGIVGNIKHKSPSCQTGGICEISRSIAIRK